MKRRRLKLSSTNDAICGVCAGIAEYFENDPVIIRVLACMLLAFHPLETFCVYMLFAAFMNEY